jgi:hypothetical protein
LKAKDLVGIVRAIERGDQDDDEYNPESDDWATVIFNNGYTNQYPIGDLIPADLAKQTVYISNSIVAHTNTTLALLKNLSKPKTQALQRIVNKFKDKEVFVIAENTQFKFPDSGLKSRKTVHIVLTNLSNSSGIENALNTVFVDVSKINNNSNQKANPSFDNSVIIDGIVPKTTSDIIKGFKEVNIIGKHKNRYFIITHPIITQYNGTIGRWAIILTENERVCALYPYDSKKIEGYEWARRPVHPHVSSGTPREICWGGYTVCTSSSNIREVLYWCLDFLTNTTMAHCMNSGYESYLKINGEINERTQIQEVKTYIEKAGW